MFFVNSISPHTYILLIMYHVVQWCYCFQNPAPIFQDGGQYVHPLVNWSTSNWWAVLTYKYFYLKKTYKYLFDLLQLLDAYLNTSVRKLSVCYMQNFKSYLQVRYDFKSCPCVQYTLHVQCNDIRFICLFCIDSANEFMYIYMKGIHSFVKLILIHVSFSVWRKWYTVASKRVTIWIYKPHIVLLNVLLCFYFTIKQYKFRRNARRII
jgi:hypothetical protein